MTPRRTLQERLSEARALIGFLQTHPNPALAELAALCGYDFLILDGEHGIFSERDYLQTLQAVSFSELATFVRLRSHDTHAVGHYLDMGADGILAPNVSTTEQARALARAMRYPPAGTRGFGASLHRITRYGIDLAAHTNTARESASLLVIIESAAGVANAADILAVEGVDGVIVGPSDLSANLGSLGDFSQPSFAEAFRAIEQAAAAQGKLLGTAPYSGSPPETLVVRGHRLLIVGADISLVREAMSAQIRKVRSSIEGCAR